MIANFLRRIADALDSGKQASSQRYNIGGSQAGSILLRGNSKFDFEVVGEAQCQLALERISGGRTPDSANISKVAILVEDDANSYDSNAVAVFIDAQRVGYLPREAAKKFRADLVRLNPSNASVGCRAKIVGGWDRGDSDRGHFGVWLDVALPVEIESRTR